MKSFQILECYLSDQERHVQLLYSHFIIDIARRKYIVRVITSSCWSYVLTRLCACISLCFRPSVGPQISPKGRCKSQVIKCCRRSHITHQFVSNDLSFASGAAPHGNCNAALNATNGFYASNGKTDTWMPCKCSGNV